MKTPSSLDPEWLALVWGNTPPRVRGRRPSLTLEQITGAAIDLADVEGLDAVSMKRLAQELQVGTMTLYTYVPDKSALLQVMLDRAVSEVTFPEETLSWQQHLRRSAEILLEMYRKHPWMTQISVEGPPVTPHQVRFLESMLSALHPTGLGYKDSLDVAMSLSYFVLGVAKITSGILQAEQRSALSVEQGQEARVGAFVSMLDPVEFPMVLAAMTSPVAGPPQGDLFDSLGFRFGLDRFIDGIAAYIGTLTPETSPDETRAASD